MNKNKILQNIVFSFIKLRFKILSLIAPEKAANIAIDLFSRPHFQKIREREKEFLESTKIIRIKNLPEDIIIYESGKKDGKPVLMVHGWDSNPGSLSAINNKLVEMDYYVLALNVPSHGISKVKSTNMLETAYLIIKVLEEFADLGKFSFVTHSFGSGAVSFALGESGIEVDNMIFITSPDKILDVFDDFRNTIGLGNKAYDYMLRFSEEKFNRRFEDMVISKILKRAKFNKLLIVHDKKDKILPFENAINIQKNNSGRSEIFATDGKGHYRILWDKKVLKKIEEFCKKNVTT